MNTNNTPDLQALIELSEVLDSLLTGERSVHEVKDYWMRHGDSIKPAPTLPGAGGGDADSERDWRLGWACSYSGSNLYSDDGELQDNATSPFIDWLHDSAACIAMKIEQRAAKQAAAMTPQQGG